MNDKKCVGCDAPLDADAIFCNECGAVQAAAVTAVPVSGASPNNVYKNCPRCAKRLEETVRFCSGCAFDFNHVAAPAAASTSCPGCQKLFDENDRFCRHCAFDLSQIAKVSSAHFCTGCGNAFSAADKFCRHCAADLSNSNHTVGVPVVSVASKVPGASNPIPQFSSTLSPISPVESVSPPTATVSDSVSSRTKKAGGLQWLTPATATFALICFFMPWVEVSCSAFGSKVAGNSVSGADLARFDASLWLLPLLAIIILIVFFIFKSQGRLSKARPLIGVAAGFGLLFMIFKALSLENSMRGMPATSFGTEWRTGLDIEPRFGVFGMVLSFIGALIGIAFFGGGTVVRNATAAAAFELKNFELKNPDGSLRANVSATLCYVLPFVIPIVLFLLIGAVGFSSIEVLVVSLALQFGAPTLFMKLNGNKRNLLVRFHAFQAIFLLAAYYAASLIIAGVIMADASGRFNPSALIRLLLILQLGVGVTMLGALIFMAFKAYKNLIYKLPYIGEPAMSFAQKGADR